MSQPLFSWRTALASEDGPDSSTTRHVLLTISLHMGERGESCFPSLRTLAKETGLNKSTVSRHIKKAEDDGWIRREKRTRKNGADSSTVYRPSVPDSFEMDDGGPCCTEQHGGLQRTTGGVAEDNTKVNSTTSTHTAPAREEDQDSEARAVEVYHEHFPRRLNNIQKDQVRQRVEDVTVWEGVCRYWRSNGYRPSSVGKMLNAYDERVQEEDDPYAGQRDPNKSTAII